MSVVTNIKTINNRLGIPVTVKNGENGSQTFTMRESWNEDLWIPHVDNEQELWKALLFDWRSRKISIFQHGDRIMYIWDNPDWDQKGVMPGNARIGGEKALVIVHNNYLELV